MEADQGNQGTPKTVRGVEFVSKDLIVPNSNIPPKVIVEFPKYGQSVKIRRMFDNESMDEEHGRMRLRKDGKIVLYNDSASVTSIHRGKWIKKLSTGEHYQVRHGDSIIFGTTEYEAKGSKPVRVEMRVILEEYPAPIPLSTASSEPIAHQQPAVHKRGPRRNKSDPNLANTFEREKGNRKRLSAQPTLDKNLNAQQDTPGQSRTLSPSRSRMVKQDVDKAPQIAVTPPKPAIPKQDNNKPEATHRLMGTEIHRQPHSPFHTRVAKQEIDKSSSTQVKVIVSPPRLAVPKPGHRNNKSTSDLPGTSKSKRHDGQRPIEHPSHLLDDQPETRSRSTSPAQVVKPGIDQSSTAQISVAIAPPKLSAQVRRNNKSTSDLPDAKARRAQGVDDRPPSGHPKSRSQKHPPSSSRSPSPAAKEDVGQRKRTQLNRELTIPARPGLELGDGVDVLTGDRMMCALESTARVPPRNSAIPEARSSTNIITRDNLYTLRSEYGANVGAKINLPCAMDIGADIRSLFLKESHKGASIFFVQYQAEGTFPMERLKNPTIKAKLRNKSPESFRNMHGDYFVDGIISGYRHRIIVACSAKDVGNKKETEHEAKLSVANFFQLGGKSVKEAQTSENYSILDARMELYGYPVTATSLTAGSLEEARKILKALRPPTGSPISVVLRHYSLLDYPQFPMEVNIDPSVFKHLQEMREIHTRLQTLLVHPALSKTLEEDQVSRATRRFEDQRPTLAADSPEVLEQQATILDELEDAEMEANNRVRRWSLIEKTREMSRDIRISGPGNQSYIWECGLLGVPVTGEFGNLKRVELKSGEVVWEIEWTTPRISERRHWPLRSSAMFKHLRLSSESGGGRRGFVAKTDTPTFDQCIVGTEFIVLGWSLSCICANKTPPQVTAKLPDQCILKDEFEFSSIQHIPCTTTVTVQSQSPADLAFARPRISQRNVVKTASPSICKRGGQSLSWGTTE